MNNVPRVGIEGGHWGPGSKSLCGKKEGSGEEKQLHKTGRNTASKGICN